MNPQDILRYVDSLHRDKNIDKEIVFSAIESALQTAAKRQYGEDADVVVQLDRVTGRASATLEGQEMGEDQIGRIGAQTAKQVIIQKVREAERDALMVEYRDQIGQMVGGMIGRADGGVATVQLGNVEAILPRSEQIPGESLHANERIRAVVYEVRASGNRVRVVLSRNRPQLVQRLFEQEIPELSDGTIEINSISREPGYRSKVAVRSADPQVDPIAVCVGFRGSRIKAVREELAGEHIDVVRFSDDPQVLIPNALQPAAVEQVLLCDLIGRAIVLVQEDQLSLAIGRRGQNVRLASKLCGWDIEIMTADELEAQIERAVAAYSEIDGVDEELAQRLVEQGYLSYDDLSVIEPDALMELGGLTEEQVERIVDVAETKAEEAEIAAAEERRVRREREKAPQPEAQPDAEAASEDGEQADGAPAADSTETDGEESASAESAEVGESSGSGTAGDGTADGDTETEKAEAEKAEAGETESEKAKAEKAKTEGAETGEAESVNPAETPVVDSAVSEDNQGEDVSADATRDNA
jgi:N utilization substance protein A